MQVSIGSPYVPGEPVQAPAIDSSVSGKLMTERRTLSGAVAAINQSGAFGPQREMSFLVDQASGRLVVQIVDIGSGQVLSQIPSEYVLEMAAQPAKLESGADSPQHSLTGVDTIV
jgi:hypothetical protein